MSTILCVIRHGQSEGNVDQNCYVSVPNEDIELTELGVQQVQNLAQKLPKALQEATDTPFSTGHVHYYTSPFKRAVHTCDILATATNTTTAQRRVEPLLSEQQYGMATGDAMESFVNSDEQQATLYASTKARYYRPPQGESLLDVMMRAGLFVERECWFRYTYNIVVAHKSTNLCLESYLLGNELNDSSWDNGEARIYLLESHMKVAYMWRKVLVN